MLASPELSRSGKKIYARTRIIMSSVQHIASLPVYQNCWIRDYLLFHVVVYQVTSVVNLGIDMAKMNMVIGQDMGIQIDTFGVNNTCGIFRCRDSMVCSYTKVYRRVTYYFFGGGGANPNGMPMAT